MNRTAIESLSAVQSPPKGYCMGCSKFHSESEMTVIFTGKQRRRVCTTCQAKFFDRREAERKVKV